MSSSTIHFMKISLSKFLNLKSRNYAKVIAKVFSTYP